MSKNRSFNIEIDKLTRSIENAISGDSFKTEVNELTSSDIRKIKKVDWVFNWKVEANSRERIVYKLVIVDNQNIIQGLVSL